MPAPSAQIIEWFLKNGGRKVSSTSDVRGEYIIYCVTNGNNILAVGEGRSNRLKGLIEGSSCQKHFKSFIVAAGQTVLKGKNNYYYRAVATKAEAEDLEDILHAQFGEAHIVGLGPHKSMSEVGKWLLGQLKKDNPEISDRLDAVLSVVCYDGDILVTLLKIEEFGFEINKLLKGYYAIPRALANAA